MQRVPQSISSATYELRKGACQILIHIFFILFVSIFSYLSHRGVYGNRRYVTLSFHIYATSINGPQCPLWSFQVPEIHSPPFSVCCCIRDPAFLTSSWLSVLVVRMVRYRHWLAFWRDLIDDSMIFSLGPSPWFHTVSCDIYSHCI